MTRLAKILKDGLFLGAFLILASLIVAKIDLVDDTRIAGPFYAIDGDTLAAGGERLRLLGLDAPESDQTCGPDGGQAWPCGDAAREALSRLASSPEAECSGSKRDRYGRFLVHCLSGRTDINAELVRQGMAVASGDYQTQERLAQEEKKGIWSGPFETPRAWRSAKGRQEEEGAVQPVLDWLKGLWS